MKINAYKKNGETLYRFVAYIGIDPATGKQKQVRRSGFRTQRDAKLEYAKITAQGNTKQLQKKKLFEVCDIWLSYYESTVSGSTYKKTKGYLEHHVKPFFGDVYIQKVFPMQAQAFSDHIHKTLVDASPVVSLAKRVFQYAKTPLKVITNNPFDDILRPKAKKKQKSETDNYYTKKELTEFLKCAKESASPMWYLFFHLLAHTGLRRGEAMALTWEDVDFKNRTLTISKGLTRDRDNLPVISTPKNEASKRTIDLDPITTYKLKQWHYKHRTERFIFFNTKGSFCAMSQPVRRLKAVTDRNGLKYISPHGLRHTHCSMLFASGATLPQVKERLGHEDIATTLNIYNHVYKEEKREAVVKYLDYLRK